MRILKIRSIAICAVLTLYLSTVQANEPEEKQSPPKAGWDFLPEIVATIGDQKITRKDVIDHIKARMPQMPADAQIPQELKMNIAKQVARGMIDTRILLDLAAKKGITPSAKLAKEHLDAQKKQLSPKELEDIENSLMASGVSLGEYEKTLSESEQYREGAVIAKWIKDVIDPTITITDKDVEDYYNKNKNLFKEPANVTVSHILIEPEDDSEKAKKAARTKAEELLASLKDGADFGALAEKESACPSGKRTKGNLGPIVKGTMVPEFEKAAFALKAGELSDVVETKFGYHVIKCAAKKEERIVPLDEVKSKLNGTIRIEKETTIIDDILKGEKEKRNVKINI